MTENIRQINEKQYKDIFLNETMHYPDFLDKLKGDVTTAVSTKLIQLIRSKKQNDTFEIKTECEYVDKITVNVVVSYGRDIKDKKNYALQYFNTDDELSDGKLRNPKLNIHIPSERDATDLATVAYGIAHELTHLYDDWNSIRNGKGHLKLKHIECDANSITQELHSVGCGLGNYREAIKGTKTYKLAVENKDFDLMKEFGSVVQHYLDMLDEGMIKHNCIFVR